MRALPFLVALLAQPALADVPRVVADTPVVQSLAAAVMGDLGAPGLLLDPGADAHDFQLRPSQRAALGDAEIVFWVGPEFTPWLERALQAATPDQTVALLAVAGTRLREWDGTEGDSHADSHDHGAIDPHAWLDPDNAVVWLDAIAEALTRQDGANSGAYLANAEAAKVAIQGLAAEIAADLDGAPHAPILVAHDALAYFADRFGLIIAASVATGDAAAPGAGHLSEVRALLQAGEAACVFPEAGTDPKTIETLAQGTPARIGGALDPEGRAMEPGPELYVQVLRHTAETIRDCLSAAP